MAILLMVLIPGLTFMHVLAHKRQRKEVKRFLERTVGLEVAEDLFLPGTAEYAHIKKGSEIVLGNNKYDVLQVTAVPGGYRIKAFNDKVEKALENQIFQQTEGGQGSAGKAKPLWFDKLHWAVNGWSTDLFEPFFHAAKCGFHGFSPLPSCIIEVVVPPPQGCFCSVSNVIS